MTGTELDQIDQITRIAARRATVLAAIAQACARADRNPGEVTLLAVSKTVPVATLVAAVATGLDRLGENRVQEAAAKAPDVAGATWELIGPLQSNKARRAIETFDRIQSVDSLELAQRLDRISEEIARPAALPVLLQVNVDDDAAKAGFDPVDLATVLPEILRLGHLRVDGLMTIGRLTGDPEEARSTFRGLREVGARLRDANPNLGPELSMGMSQDYPIAVEEGATIVRVGRALFGERVQSRC